MQTSNTTESMGNYIENSEPVPVIDRNLVGFNKNYVHLIYKETNPETNEKFQAMIPLKSTHIDCLIQDGLAKMDLKFEFVNECSVNPVETTLEFPCDKKTLVSRVHAQIDDRQVEAKVETKQKAAQKYDDAVAAGNTATIMEKQKSDEGFTLKLGNLHPGKTATVNISLSKFLEIESGCFKFRMPTNYFPDYSLIEKMGLKVPQYTFTYKLDVKSLKPITYLSSPGQSKTDVKIPQKHIIVTSDEITKIPKRDQMLYFKTSDMGLPTLKAQRCEKYPDEVALLASFVPTFEKKQPQENTELFEDEVPDQGASDDIKYCYMFLVDRSGSMAGSRMNTTKEALKLFLKSLPPNCAFQITSFGTSYKHMKDQIMDYNEKTLEYALRQVESFGADLGGTQIYTPLYHLINNMPAPGYIKRIFMLTDGCVMNPKQVTELAGQQADKIRIHTFGVGNDCDSNLITGVAKVGRGSYSYARNLNDELKGLVIKALRQASEPSLTNCEFDWNNQKQNLGEIFRNQLITQTLIVSQNEFVSIKAKFQSFESSEENTKVEVKFDTNDFELIEDGDLLFKHAAHDQINKSYGNVQIQKSLKYQVICPHTAMVGVIKQKDKTTGEMVEQTIAMGTDLKIQQYPVQAKISQVSSYVDVVKAIRPKPQAYVAPQVASSSTTSSYYGSNSVMMSMKSAAASTQQMMYSDACADDLCDAMDYQQDYEDDKQEFFAEACSENEDELMAELDELMAEESMQEMDAHTSYVPVNLQACAPVSAPQNNSQYQQEEDDLMALMMGGSCESSYQPTYTTQQTSPSPQKPVKQTPKEQPKSPIKKTVIEQPKQEEKKQPEMPASNIFMAKSVSPQIKPLSLDELINGQTSQGNWSSTCGSILSTFISGSMADATLQQELKKLNEKLATEIWHTIIALFILEGYFDHKVDEWDMIARKAKTWLKQNGLPKPESYINKISLTLN